MSPSNRLWYIILKLLKWYILCNRRKQSMVHVKKPREKICHLSPSRSPTTLPVSLLVESCYLYRFTGYKQTNNFFLSCLTFRQHFKKYYTSFNVWSWSVQNLQLVCENFPDLPNKCIYKGMKCTVHACRCSAKEIIGSWHEVTDLTGSCSLKVHFNKYSLAVP